MFNKKNKEMKLFVTTLVFFFSCIFSSYAQISDEEFETEFNKLLKVQTEDLWQMYEQHNGKRVELEKELFTKKQKNNITSDEESELRKKIEVEKDSLKMRNKKLSIIRQQSDSLRIKWVRGVLPSEESSTFVRRLLEISDEGDRRKFFPEYLRTVWTQDSIAGISENVRSRRIKAFVHLFRVYEQKNVQKPKLIKKVSGGEIEFSNSIKPFK